MRVHSLHAVLHVMFLSSGQAHRCGLAQAHLRAFIRESAVSAKLPARLDVLVVDLPSNRQELRARAGHLVKLRLWEHRHRTSMAVLYH